MRCGGRWRRSTKARACSGCRRISIIASGRCSPSRGFSMSMPRSSRSTAIRRVRWSATIRANRGGRRIAITPTCCRICDWCCGLRCIPTINTIPSTPPPGGAARARALAAPVARRCRMGQRRGDGAGRAGGIAVSVLPARHRECETGAGARDGGQGWQGKETTLRLMGWSRQRRVVLLRRQFNRPLALLDRTDPGQPLLGFAEVLGGKREVWEYAALVTSLDSEILTLGQLYRDRADCENAFDELKNHWGWGGFTTQDLKRCRLLAASVALIYNWWSLFVRLADPDQHREVITSRPLLLQAIARKTQHAGRITLSVSSTHGEQQVARRAYLRIARFFASLRAKAEQLDAVQRWYRILSEALRKYLRGRQLIPPARLQPG